LHWTASADLGAHPILNTSANHYYCLPNKIFEYIQAEIPVAVSNFPEMQKIVDTYQIGVTFNPEDPKDIAAKIQACLGSPTYRENLRQAKAILNWENEAKALLTLYQTVLN
jgi:glycosyltransferase involved in cell wall biosynthesis